MFYQVEMRHTEKTLEALSHMQYDLFCGRNRISRSVLSLALMVFGVINFTRWWGILLTAYGCYLITGTYNAANRTARDLVKQIRESGMDFPASRYVFRKSSMEVISLPEEKSLGKLAYADVCRLGEDGKYFYLFRDQYGGYMIPKEALEKKESEFRAFVEEKTGQGFRGRTAPAARLYRRLRRKKGN